MPNRLHKYCKHLGFLVLSFRDWGATRRSRWKVNSAKSSFKIHEAGTDMGKLYFFLNTLVGGKNKELLPENVSDTRLANNFSAFFENKITDICAHIESNDEAINHLPDIPYCKFDKFKEVTLSDTKDIL